MYIIKDNKSKQTSKVSAIKDSTLKTINNIYAVVQNEIKLVWTSIKDIISSVFGSGKWMNNEPWDNNDTWKNN